MTGGPAAAKPRRATSRLDPDEFVHLQEERDFLLASLDDLEREHDAGDLTDDDYVSLRDDYTARAAEVLRAIDERRSAFESTRRPRSTRRTVAVIAAVVLFAAVAGVLLARGTGARGVDDTITGGINSSLRAQLAACQPLSFQKPKDGIACYRKILATSPQDTEALTYLGWAQVRDGQVAAGSANFAKVVAIDPKYPDVYVFMASVAKNAKDFTTAQKDLDTLYALNPPKGIISTLQQMGLDKEVAYGLLDPDVQKCWTLAQKALDALGQASSGSTTTTAPAGSAGQPFLDALQCADNAARAHPTDVQPLVLAGFLLAAGGAATAGPAQQTLDKAVQLAPKDPTARLVRAAFEAESGNLAASTADLDVLATLPGQPSPLYPVATADVIRQSIASQQSTTTTAPSTTTTVPGLSN